MSTATAASTGRPTLHQLKMRHKSELQALLKTPIPKGIKSKGFQKDLKDRESTIRARHELELADFLTGPTTVSDAAPGAPTSQSEATADAADGELKRSGDSSKLPAVADPLKLPGSDSVASGGDDESKLPHGLGGSVAPKNKSDLAATDGDEKAASMSAEDVIETLEQCKARHAQERKARLLLLAVASRGHDLCCGPQDSQPDKGQSKRLFDLRMQERHARELDYLADKLGLAETAIELPMPQPPDNEGKLVSPADAWVKRMSKAQKRKVDSQSLMVS